jgi:proline dehydrogenase
VAERKRAETLGLPSPIHETIAQTHECFNECVEIMLRKLAEQTRAGKQPVNVMIASHNQQSIEIATELMHDLDIDRTKGGVFFGQLLGMADHLTFTLGQCGYAAYKYVPYGPIDEVIAYLLRRLQENSNMMGGVAQERKLLQSELKRRLHLD